MSYSQRIWKTPVRFTINVLGRTRDGDDRSENKALTRNEALAWKAAINKEIDTLQCIGCWDIVKRAHEEQMLYAKLVLKRKRNDKEAVSKCEASFKVRRNEEPSYDDKSFLPVADFTIVY